MTTIKPYEEFQIEVFHRQFLRETITLVGKCIIWAFLQSAVLIFLYVIALSITAAGNESSEAANVFLVFLLAVSVISGVALIVYLISGISKLINYHAVIKKNENELLSRIPAIEIETSASKEL